MEARWRCGITRMTDKVRGDESGGQAQWQNFRETRDGYNGRGDVGRQQKKCGTTEMVKCVGRTATEWANINR